MHIAKDVHQGCVWPYVTLHMRNAVLVIKETLQVGGLVHGEYFP